jgi:predicted kinase
MARMSFRHVSGPPLSDEPRPGLVRLLCGVAGAGKTTYAKQLENLGFTRLSIDEEIWRRFGRYGLDYPPSDYTGHQETAEQLLRAELVGLMCDRAPVVIDSSFWRRETRDRYKALIVEHGCQWDLVHLVVDVPTLRERLTRRSERFDANAAFSITETQMLIYLEGFEVPRDEGAIVLRWEPAWSG